MAEERTPSILYVDDDPANRRTFSMVLRHAGFETREAATGGDALRLAAEQPDLIILDVNLPDIDGFEVCRRIKAHPATSSIPVLHMSAVYVRSEDKTHGLEGGADGYLTKPVEPAEVVATVHSLLRIHRAEEAAREPPASGRPPSTPSATRSVSWTNAAPSSAATGRRPSCSGGRARRPPVVGMRTCCARPSARRRRRRAPRRRSRGWKCNSAAAGTA